MANNTGTTPACKVTSATGDFEVRASSFFGLISWSVVWCVEREGSLTTFARSGVSGSARATKQVRDARATYSATFDGRDLV